MSILIAYVTRDGILLGADRYITAKTNTFDGRTNTPIRREWQTERPKVLKWPNRNILIGYMGLAEIRGVPTDVWLYERVIGRNLGDELLLDSIARNVTYELNALGEEEEVLYLYVAGFERAAPGEWTPQLWHIDNTDGLTTTGAYIRYREFRFGEVLRAPAYLNGLTGGMAREALRVRRPIFHQGYDLGVFQTLSQPTRQAMDLIVRAHPLRVHPAPEEVGDVSEWEKHLRFQINLYGAYFTSFFEPGERKVGGGADVVSAPWPT